MAIEQLYDLQVAAQLIPYPYKNLRRWICNRNHLFPPIYRKQGPIKRKVRLLRERDIETIRKMVLIGYGQ